jgi:PRTRC genetic system protein B
VLGSYRPELALVIYHEVAKDDSYDNSRGRYIESHHIDDQGRLLEGKPLSVDAIEGMVGVFFDENKSLSTITGLIPECVLFYDSLPAGKYKLIWYRPAQQRILHFTPNLNIRGGQAWVPPMLYIASPGSLTVYALLQETRPDGETYLYRAPYHNVDANGVVCLGSARAKKPAQTYDAVIAYWEEMFWNSEFAHITGNESPVKGNLNLLWQELIGNPITRFPLEELKPGPNKKLKNILR